MSLWWLFLIVPAAAALTIFVLLASMLWMDDHGWGRYV